MSRLAAVRTLLVGLLLVAATALAAPLALADHGSDGSGSQGDQGSAKGKPASTATPGAPSTAAPGQNGQDNRGGGDAADDHRSPTSLTPGSSGNSGGEDRSEAAAKPTVMLDTDAPGPALGRAFGVAQASGTVRVRTADGRAVHGLELAASLPVGAHVDTREGTVQLATAVDAAGTTQFATLSGGIFELRQAANGKGLSQIILVGGNWGQCRAHAATTRSAVAVAAKARKRKPVRRLWATDDHGRFQSRGRGSVATVRGTRWLTEDYCDGTLTRVAQGAVAVHDLAKHKTVVVKAGHSYFARTAR